MTEKRRYNVEKKEKTIEFRISENDFKCLAEKMKEKEQKNLSAVLRSLVKDYIKS
jgi:hypothetical protein